MAKQYKIPKATPSMQSHTKNQPRWGWWKAYCRANFLQDFMKRHNETEIGGDEQ